MKLKLLIKWNQRRKKLQESETRCDDKYLIFEGSHENYIRNGALVLEESIALFHGRANPFRHFSVGELNTMNVETVPIHQFARHNLYKGSWEGRDVIVGIRKRGDIKIELDFDELFLPEIVVAAEMATRTNVHKLLGCCLETFKPVLVYEWVAPQTLQDCILLEEDIQHQRVVLEWKDRLRIAWEISHIIGKDSLTLCRDIQDTIGKCAKAREMCIYKMIDPTISRNGVTDIEELQLRYSIQTALLCINLKENCRPTMVEVATVLMNIIKSPQNIITSSISKMFQLDHYNNHTVCNCDNDNNDNNDEEYYDCEQNKDHDNDNNDEEYYDCEQNKDHDNDNNDEEYYDCEQNKDQCHDDAQG